MLHRRSLLFVAAATATLVPLAAPTPAAAQAAPTVTLDSSANPSSIGRPVTFTATVDPPPDTSPPGTVTFTDGGQPVAGCVDVPLATSAASCTVSTLGLGPHFMAASYGDAVGMLVQVVGRAPTRLAVAPAGRILPTYRATLATTDGVPIAGGSVSFSAPGSPGCTAVTDGAGVASCPVRAIVLLGPSYTATFAGDDTHQPAGGTGRLQLLPGLF